MLEFSESMSKKAVASAARFAAVSMAAHWSLRDRASKKPSRFKGGTEEEGRGRVGMEEEGKGGKDGKGGDGGKDGEEEAGERVASLSSLLPASWFLTPQERAAVAGSVEKAAASLADPACGRRRLAAERAIRDAAFYHAALRLGEVLLGPEGHDVLSGCPEDAARRTDWIRACAEELARKASLGGAAAAAASLMAGSTRSAHELLESLSEGASAS